MSCWDTIKSWFSSDDTIAEPGTKPDTISGHDAPSTLPDTIEPPQGHVVPAMHHVDSLGVIKGKYSSRETDTIKGVVVHSTGGGLWRRWAKDNPRIKADTIPEYNETRMKWHQWQARKGKEPYPFDTAARVYATIMEAGPHYLVCGDTGRVMQMCPLDLTAWHVGRAGRDVYQHGVDNDHWLARWPYRSPLGLLGYHEWTEANALTVGIEVAPPRAGYSEPWSTACHNTLDWIVNVHIKEKLPRYNPRAENLVSHWDLHPNARSLNSGLPWDPFDRQWLPAKAYILDASHRDPE